MNALPKTPQVLLRVLAILLILPLQAILLISCGSSGSGGTFTSSPATDTTPPAVESTTPGDGATGVAVNTFITVAFSKAMDGATIN